MLLAAEYVLTEMSGDVNVPRSRLAAKRVNTLAAPSEVSASITERETNLFR